MNLKPIAKAKATPENRTRTLFQEFTCLNCGRRSFASAEREAPPCCEPCTEHLAQHASSTGRAP